MMYRAGLRTTSLVAKRGFTSSAVARSGHLPEGPYTNIPFKVHDRKIPYWAVHWTFFGEYH
jgi:cytochrome c oxidase subunit 7c